MDIDSIRNKINAVRFSDGDDTERNYLGASEIGAECSRQLWLKFHRYSQREQFEPRMIRLFHRGKREEIVFDSLLELAGYECIKGSWDQEGFKDGFFEGHSDGVWLIEGQRCNVEYKTHGAKSFATLKPGSIPATHYAQCIVYPGYMNCEGTLYMAVNKDTDELFIEWIPFDAEQFEKYKAKAEYITRSDRPPERICKTPMDFKAKFCHERNVCFGMEMPRVSCMNCTSLHKYQDTFGCDAGQQVGEPCELHSFNPYAMQSMLGWEPVEFFPKERAVKYIKNNNEPIINGAAPYGTPSNELK